MTKYGVLFSVTGTTRITVEAKDEEDAVEKAREIADDSFELDDGEIDWCLNVEEVKE